MAYRELYKARGISRLGDNLAKRCQNVAAERQEKQRELFWSKRGQANVATPVKSKAHEKKKNERAELLAKWKIEKLKAQEEEKKKRKPAFKVGIVQKTATGSPLLLKKSTKKKSHVTDSNLSKPQTNTDEVTFQGVLTRSRAKGNAILNEIKLEFQENPIKQTVNNNLKLKNKFCEIHMGRIKQLHGYEFKLPKSVSELPHCSKLNFQSSQNLTNKSRQLIKPKTNEENTMNESDSKETNMHIEEKFDEMQISENKLKSDVQKDYFEGIDTLEPTILENNECKPNHFSPRANDRSCKKIKNPRISSPSIIKEETKEKNEFKSKILSFRNYVESEIRRLLDRCDKWKCIYEEFDEIPLDVEGEIDSIVGKTKLLTSDKFMQFKDLIEKCEANDPLIKLNDLQGFQDWIAIEVEKVDEDFAKLEKRKNNNWIAETSKPDIPKTKKIKSNKNGSKKIEAKSNIRSHINAVRKLLKQESITASSPSSTLLKNVLNSETKKRNNFSATIANQNNEEQKMAVFEKKKSPSIKNTTSTGQQLITVFNETEYPDEEKLRKTPNVLDSMKTRFHFQQKAENIGSRGKGLNEKYFKPSVEDALSPKRLILGDLNLNTPSKMATKSKTIQQNT